MSSPGPPHLLTLKAQTKLLNTLKLRNVIKKTRADNQSTGTPFPQGTKPRSWLGWCLYDWANSAFATVILAAVLPVYFVHLVP